MQPKKAERLRQARREDLTWLARTGETSEGAAARIGLTVDSLERWCDKNARDLWHQLRANDTPQGHGARAGKLTVTR